MSNLTPREEALLYALKESHKLLVHYSQLLNQYDGGKRKIHKDVHRWIKHLNQIRPIIPESR